MPEAVQAYKAKSGALYERQQDAAEADAIHDLERLWAETDTGDVGKHQAGFTSYMLDHAKRIHAALDPIIQATKGPVMRSME